MRRSSSCASARAAPVLHRPQLRRERLFLHQFALVAIERHEPHHPVAAEEPPAVRLVVISKAEVWLKQQRDRRADFGAATSNHHMKAVKSFAEWARTKLKRKHERNPLEPLKTVDEKVDVRRPRRAPDDDELKRLLEAVWKVGFNYLSPEDREMLYRFTLATGLRASESASLYPRSITLTAQKSEVKVRAAYSKTRREDIVTIATDSVATLKQWLKGKPADQPLWPGRWADEGAEMLRKDLAVAGIEYRTDDGFFDFHATRHSAITTGGRV
jgi:integrase